MNILQKWVKKIRIAGKKYIRVKDEVKEWLIDLIKSVGADTAGIL